MDDDGDRPSRACGHDTPPAREFSQPPDPGAGRWTDGLGSLNESRRPWCFRQQFLATVRVALATLASRASYPYHCTPRTDNGVDERPAAAPVFCLHRQRRDQFAAPPHRGLRTPHGCSCFDSLRARYYANPGCDASGPLAYRSSEEDHGLPSSVPQETRDTRNRWWGRKERCLRPEPQHEKKGIGKGLFGFVSG
jgi:hypothetical protein